MLSTLLIVLSLLTFSFAQTANSRHAIIPYEGHCEVDGQTYECRGKGFSADFTTMITPSGNVHMNVRRLTGSLSVWTCNGTFSVDGTFTEQGNFTFGVHNTHDDHYLTYELSGIIDTEDQFQAGNGLLKGGKGAWEGVSGVVSAVLQYIDDKNFIGGVTMFVDPPANQ